MTPHSVYDHRVIMPTYIYETIPSRPDEVSRRFEVKQSMKESPLERDPETGVPVRRVISGGFAPLVGGGDSSSTPAPAPSRHSCGSACGCFGN